MSSELLDQNAKPAETISVREVFGIDTDMEIKAFGERSSRVPEVDSTYKFAPNPLCSRWRTGENGGGV